MPKFGHSVEVVPFAPSRKYPKVIRHINYFFRILKALQKNDLVFAQDVLSVGLPSLIAAAVLNKPLVVRVPGDYAWEQSSQRYGVKDSIDEFQNKKYSWQVELLRSLQKCVVRHAKQVVTPSDYFNRLVCGWGVKPEKVTTIYNGVSFDFEIAPIAKSSNPMIVSVGRLVPWKGFATLIKIMKDLPQWHLVIIGSGPDKDILQTLIDKENLSNRVRLLGSRKRSEVLDWCGVADVFVLNTHFESFSYQIVEAMSVGVPVISTNIGSIPELIESGREGLLFNPDDVVGMKNAIDSILTQKEIWQGRVDQAKNKVKKFDIATTSAALSELLNKVVKK